MQRLVNPAISGFISQAVGVLVMSGYITPKGQTAITDLAVYLIGGLLVLLPSLIAFLHHAEVKVAELNAPKITAVNVKTTSPGDFSQNTPLSDVPLVPTIPPTN